MEKVKRDLISFRPSLSYCTGGGAPSTPEINTQEHHKALMPPPTASATSRINYHVLANRPQSSTHAINSYLATAFLVILSVTHHSLECVHLLHTRLAHHTHMLKGLSYLLHLLSRPLARCRPRCTRKAAACAAPPPPHPLPFGLSF